MRIARSTLIGTAVAMALFGRNNVVQAQTSGDATTSNQNEQLQEVVVTGIRASLEQSLEAKRSADSVVDVITAEDIGKMPDKNIADSLSASRASRSAPPAPARAASTRTTASACAAPTPASRRP